MSDQPPQPDPSAAPPPAPSAPPFAGSFEFNRPTIIGLLYVSSFVLGVTVIIGVVLAYVWRGEPHEDWEDTHYRYLIRTFWIGLIGSGICVMLMLALIGFVLLPALAVLVIVRCVLSLVNAQKRQPMPDPQTWLA